MRTMRPWLLLLLLTISATACAANAKDPDFGPRASEIQCHTAYRSNPGGPIETETEVTLTDSDGQQDANFGDLDFHAQYGDGQGDGERSLRLGVSPAGKSDTLTSILFQLPLDGGPQNQFVGGHGFTGLHYVYHPDGAELQFWCQVP